MHPLPRLRKQDGQLCASHQEITEEWRRHFAELEGGSPTTPDALLAECLTAQQGVQGPDELDWTLVPDLWTSHAGVSLYESA